MGRRMSAWLYCIIWMAVIFFMSAMPGEISDEESGMVVRLLTAFLQLIPGNLIDRIDVFLLELLVRKAAHMLEYAILFVLYRRALTLSGVRFSGIAALLLCVIYASTDEFHQSFVEGRACASYDVIIDTLGAALAWIATSASGRT